MFNLPIYGHTLSKGYMKFGSLYNIFTLSIQDKYANCTKVHKVVICEEFK